MTHPTMFRVRPVMTASIPLHVAMLTPVCIYKQALTLHAYYTIDNGEKASPILHICAAVLSAEFPLRFLVYLAEYKEIHTCLKR